MNMQNGVAVANKPTKLSSAGEEDVEVSIDLLPPPPSPIPGLSEAQDSAEQLSDRPNSKETPSGLSHPAKKGTTLERMIHSPLPPMLDSYAIEYGPVSSTEPELAPVTDDGELPRFDEINDQYDFLRRTLSHSRTRYSSRFKRPLPRSHNHPASSTERERTSYIAQREGDDLQSSLDAPGLSRRQPRTSGGSVSQTGRCQTVTGDHPLRRQQRRPPGTDRRSVPVHQMAGKCS